MKSNLIYFKIRLIVAGIVWLAIVFSCIDQHVGTLMFMIWRSRQVTKPLPTRSSL